MRDTASSTNKQLGHVIDAAEKTMPFDGVSKITISAPPSSRLSPLASLCTFFGELGGTFFPQGDTWYSSDGVTWTQQLTGSHEFSGRGYHGFASHGGKLWIYGGEGIDGEIGSHDLFWSLEGTDWHYRHHNLIEIP